MSETWDESGFAIFQDVLEPSDIERAATALDTPGARRSRAGLRGLMGNPIIASLARDPRLMRIAYAVLGDAAVPYRATLFEKSGKYNWLIVWHQDTALPIRVRLDVPGWGPWSVKAGVLHAHAPAEALASIVALRIHLDDADITTGPLRVLPGTHRLGVLTDEEVQRLARKLEPVDCLAGRGGVIAMRPLTVHASSKATAPAPCLRRVIHIEYAQGLDLANGLQLAIC